MVSKSAPSRPPSVDSVVRSGKGQRLVAQYGRPGVTQAVRLHIDALRDRLNDTAGSFPSTEELLSLVENDMADQASFSLRPVINLTGTVLHTNLGRAALPVNAVKTIIEVAQSAANLEFDIDTGQRGDRDNHIESLITELTGAEAATVVNNNAAAVLLVLNTLALGRQVPVSRGELVEIGGSFRIPEIMSRSGCTLVEVGATNRTHLKDYRNAISDDTALLMKVHTSNYAIQGFTNSVSETEVAQLAHAHNLPFVTDLGSGNLVDLSKFGLPGEPTVNAVLLAGADVVTFSGDKLLGGPQAGLIVGKRRYIEEIKNNPMKRALRVDKLTIAALFEVLKLYRDPDSLSESLPTMRHLTRLMDEIAATAAELIEPLKQQLIGIANVSIIDCMSQIGSGSLPLEQLKSKAICIIPNDARDSHLRAIALSFRQLPVPVIGRIHDGKLLFDLRTLDDSAVFLAQLDHLVAPGKHA